MRWSVRQVSGGAPMSAVGAYSPSTFLPTGALVSIELKHRQGAAVIEAPGAPGVAGRIDRALVRAIALARSWSIRLASGDAPSLKTLAMSEGYCDHYAARLLPLAWLAPDLVELILQGRQPAAISLGALTRRPLPVSWEDQRQLFRGLGGKR